MTCRLVAVGDRRRTLMVLVAVSAAAVALMATPAGATAAAGGSRAGELARGAGMGDRPSRAVRRVQRVLDRRGYDLGAPGVDGRFGPITDRAVRSMQTDRGLRADGIVGPRTRRALALRADYRPARPTSGPTKAPATAPTVPAAPAKPANPPAPAAARTGSNESGTPWLLALLVTLGVVAAALLALSARGLRRSPDRPTTATATPVPATGPAHEPEPAQEHDHAQDHDHDQKDDHDQEDESHHDTTPATSIDEVDLPAPSRLPADARVIGYVTLAPDAPAEHADAPAHVIAQTAEQAGWQLIDVVIDRDNGRGLKRPGLTYALRQIADGRARGLLVSDLRLLSRSIIDLGALLEWFADADATLIAIDLHLDTSTPTGQHLANTLTTLAGWERERIGQRTRDALADAKAHGSNTGRPAVSDHPALIQRITTMRNDGMTLQAIADELNDEHVPTLRGGAKWRPSSVQAATGYRRPATRNPRDQLPTPKPKHHG